MKFINAIQCLDDCMTLSFYMEDWIAYAGSISTGLPQKCIKDTSAYAFEEEVLPVICDALKALRRRKALSEIFDELSVELKSRLSLLFENEPDISMILYVGLCNGAGWATELDGCEVVLLGAEKILELNWDTKEQMRALIYHEIGHIWHSHEGNIKAEAKSTTEMAVSRVYQEGLAMVCEQILCGDEHYYHQGREWTEWCQRNLDLIKREYIRRIMAEESVQDFFGDWNQFMGQQDVGYYLGAQFIRYLLRKYTLKEVAALPCSCLISQFRYFAEE